MSSAGGCARSEGPDASETGKGRTGLESGEIDDAEIGAAGCRIGSGFAQVIPARPDELAGHVGVPIHGGEHLVRGGAEVGRIEFICAYLTALRISARPVPNRRTDPRFHRKEIRSASA